MVSARLLSGQRGLPDLQAGKNERSASDEGAVHSKEFTPLPMDGGDWLNQGWVEVTLRLERSVMDRVIERFGSDHILQTDEHHCFAKYPIIPNSYGYDRLLAFGDKCEVLGPPEIRNGFKAYVRGIISKYEGD